MELLDSTLKKYWGYNSFRSSQKEIVESIYSGNDTIALLPTGGGKSICYQVPAMAKEGVCIVVSPLIALMEDQVFQLKKRNINAVAINSSMNLNQIDIILDNCIYGDVKFLYVSPERIQTHLFQERFKKMNVSFVAIDEAHCISQWGHDFRPSYLSLNILKELNSNISILAVTATATSKVVEEIEHKLNLLSVKIFKSSFLRDNLAYKVFKTNQKIETLLQYLKHQKGSGIIYINSRKKTVEITQILKASHFSASHYHAGLTNEQRSKIQEDWINNKTQIIVATNAFGMGIDKPDVRFVVHLKAPNTIEAYVQEAGRGGRDGAYSESVLFYNDNDARILKSGIKRLFPEINTIKQVYKSICNYLKLADGAGLETIKQFNIDDFCHKFNYEVTIVYYAIKCLEYEELISLIDKDDYQTKIKINILPAQLYYIRKQSELNNLIIEYLTRAFTGVFNDYITLSSFKLAASIKKSKTEVETTLEKLSSQGIIQYFPANEGMKIFFIRARVPYRSLKLSGGKYKLLKENSLSKINSMIHYFKENNECRSIYLAAYFDDFIDQKCGVCDICVEPKFDSISVKVKEALSSGRINIEVFKSLFLPQEMEEVGLILREMIDDEELIKQGNYLIKM